MRHAFQVVDFPRLLKPLLGKITKQIPGVYYMHDNEFIWLSKVCLVNSNKLFQSMHLKSSSYKEGTKTLELTLG